MKSFQISLISLASLLVCFCSCTQESTDPPLTDLPAFFAATFNGLTYGFGTGSSSNQAFVNEAFDSVAQQAPDSFHVYDGTRFRDPAGGNTGIATVGLLQIYDHLPTAEERAARADTGFFRYAFSDSIPAGGAFIMFRDGNGVAYSSSFHQQPDTSFRIVSVTPQPGSEARALLQADFNGKLYSNSGDSIMLENGSVRGVFLRP